MVNTGGVWRRRCHRDRERRRGRQAAFVHRPNRHLVVLCRRAGGYRALHLTADGVGQPAGQPDIVVGVRQPVGQASHGHRQRLGSVIRHGDYKWGDRLSLLISLVPGVRDHRRPGRHAAVVGDRSRRRVGRGHRRRCSRHAQADRERLVRFLVAVLRRRHREALRLARGAGEAERRRVLGVVGTLGGGVVREARRHRQPAGDGVVERHREGDRIALGGRRIGNRQLRRVVVDNRTGSGAERSSGRPARGGCRRAPARVDRRRSRLLPASSSSKMSRKCP